MLKKVVLASALAIASLISVNLGARTSKVNLPAPAQAWCDPQTCEFTFPCPKCPGG
jgi:hypothetical protein